MSSHEYGVAVLDKNKSYQPFDKEPFMHSPDFFPGFEAGLARVHIKHGIAAATAAVLMFAVGWYLGRSRA